jgi:hypothetical protein
MGPVEQRPVHRGEVDGVQSEPEASHGVTVDGVPQVVVEGLGRPQAEDDAIVRQGKRAPLEELRARDAQEYQAARSECMELLGQNQLGIGALRHSSQIAARSARSVPPREKAMANQLLIDVEDRLAHQADGYMARLGWRRWLR